MLYSFVLNYLPTSGEISYQRVCHPLYGNEIAISIERASGEWYYQRKFDGKLTFVGNDYSFLMSRPLDGTYQMAIKFSTDEGVTWNDYFDGTFSRADLEIDEDNCTAVLNGLTEGVYNVIENGRREEYDLMKIIPESEAKEVQGSVPPTLALVDYRQAPIGSSDIYCGAPSTAGGYKAAYQEEAWNENAQVSDTAKWNFIGIYCEAKVEASSNADDPAAAGTYVGVLQYHSYGEGQYHCPMGVLRNENDYNIVVYGTTVDGNPRIGAELFDPDDNGLTNIQQTASGLPWFSPASQVYGNSYYTIELVYHYIRAALLTQSVGSQVNILDTGDYYQKMMPFEGSGLTVSLSTRTVSQPNGHRIVPGTDDISQEPQYFAPPDDVNEWIPLAEDNWNYASMWYRITPSVQNGLLNAAYNGSFRWTRCWTIGTCLRYLLQKITGDEVYFYEQSALSQFLYNPVNPVAGGEPLQYLVTQKSNVMRPSATESTSARCIVTLDWFMELLRNAFGCYWWLERGNRNRYAMHIEHVQYFRQGHSYTGPLTSQLDLTNIKPKRNFLRGGQAAKRLSDGQNKYTYNLDGMVEKYTFSWQGDGGSDDFKGHPMLFRAGWIEKASSESHEVDNIFADLGWLMLHADTETDSSRNFDGLFLFAGYRPAGSGWVENGNPSSALVPLTAFGTRVEVAADLWVTVPMGQTFTLELFRYLPTQSAVAVATFTGTGGKQHVELSFANTYSVPVMARLNFGGGYSGVTIHRIHARSGNTFNVAHLENLLTPGTYLQNGALAWPQLQNEYLHYDIPAQQWSYDSDDTDDATFLSTGTVKMVKRQSVNILPLLTRSEENLLNYGIKGGLKDTNGDPLAGIVETARVNMVSRNCELTIVYDIMA